MSGFAFTCPHCDRRLEALDAMEGQVVACPTCKRRITIRRPARASFTPVQAQSKIQPAPRRETRARRRLVPMLAAIVGAGILAAIWIRFFGFRSRAERNANDPNSIEKADGGAFVSNGPNKPDKRESRAFSPRVEEGNDLSPKSADRAEWPEPTLFPPYANELAGANPVAVRNPNVFAVTAALRSGQGGVNLHVPANGMNTAYVPDGRYDIYFVYSSQPGALFQGDSFTLQNNGVEIRIVAVVNGNYGIRQVK